ncbi:3-hydroxyisobutyryl-CoA hydrolase-like protein 1, mitochondrial isoform X3 [Telopea speciosissima]|uniref:3-hydroxyisobutyryl-CoA hydrolase-like protein 1, mitochondrial isoform X3 n=1 Tax=Telopea speciosissima TaxID=54955 RepID=UPI001CC46A73|nr:3-hydroxyisobutyryl-CoA hydrolase-like protein 1, mitochondrial isoform X3 [Telopea speciosissima]
MQSLKGLLLKRSLGIPRFLPYHRNLCSHTINPDDSDELNNQVLVEGKDHSRTAILYRPFALNALTTIMAARLKKLYESWEENPDIGFVVMKGSGRAFCAGGDIVTLFRLLNEGGYFEWCYHGGWGRSFNPRDIPCCNREDWEYLALTGEKLNGAEMLACGLATHYALSARLPLIEERLGTLVTDDPSVIESSLEKYCDLVYPEKESALHRIERIDKCFGHDTVEEIIDALETEGTGSNDEWCTSALKKLKEASPLSLKVSLRSIREGRFQTLDQCLIREYRMSLQGISRQPNDFCEGVRARLVDKDLTPQWEPPSLDQVSEGMVDSYFSPLNKLEPDLELPTKLREAFT